MRNTLHDSHVGLSDGSSVSAPAGDAIWRVSPYDRLVVGVDGSGPSTGALAWAIAYAADHDTELLLVHVVDDTWGVAGADYMADAQRRGIHVLDASRRRAVDAGVAHVQTELVHGRAPSVLSGAARPHDLLVVGSHRTGFLRGRAFGAASVYVVAAARSAVLVVPNLPFEGRHGVVVGVSGSPASDAALMQAAREAARTDQQLVLIHARPPVPHEESSSNGEYRASAARDVVARASAHALIDIPHLDLSSRVVADNVAPVLLTASIDAAMLVIGRGQSEAPPNISAVVHDVLMNLNAPVLIVP